MASTGKLLSTIVIFVTLLVAYNDAYCQTSCVSDMQCKGFTAVNPLYMCLRGCCSSPNTVIADVRPPADCLQHNIEGFNTSEANAYPWLSLVVQKNATLCLFFSAPLIAPNWITTDNYAYTNVNDPSFTTTVYFYIDDPVRRQVYNVTGSETEQPIDIIFLQIEYIGVGEPIAIAPVPVQCNVISPTQFTMLYWTSINENNLSRTFTSKQVTVLSDADCAAALLAGDYTSRTPTNYFCVDFPTIDTDPLDHTSAFVVDASGNLQFAGVVGVNLRPNPTERISSRAAEMQSVTGAVCA